MKVLREILIGAGGAVLAGLVLAAAEEFFDALSLYVGAVPSGAVMAFDDKCPDGWKTYHDGKGRFLLGAGETDEDDDGTDHALRSKGGKERVTLAMSQMPKHRHDDRREDGEANHLLAQPR